MVKALGTLVAAGVVALAALACDPCSGVVSCTDEPALRVGGRIVLLETGDPVQGVEVALIRVSGVELLRDTVRAVTGGDGYFHLEVGAREQGSVRVHVRVTPPPPGPSYRVSNLTFETSSIRGEGYDLGRWTSEPYVAYIGQLQDRRTRTPLRPAPGEVTVDFRRTSGVEIEPALLEDVPVDFGGRFRLTADPAADGIVLGELTVHHPSLPEPYTRELRVPTFHDGGSIGLAGVIFVGPSLAYVGRVFFRDEDGTRMAVGTQVEIRRTGGIPVSRDTAVTEVMEWGFGLPMHTVHEGEVIVDLIFRPPSPWRGDTIRDLSIPTFNSDENRVLGTWELTR